MKTAFVAASFRHRHDIDDVLEVISTELTSHGYTPLVFVQRYAFAPDETREMMQTSTKHIRECDLFVAELTHKGMGIGIEAGYAFACHKPIVYIHQATADVSNTLTGIASHIIAYSSLADLQTQLHHVLMKRAVE